MNLTKAIGITLSVIVVLCLVANTLPSYAADRTAVLKEDKHISFTITDDVCTDPLYAQIPQTAPLKNASAYDSSKNETITGCALDYGDVIEFNLHDSEAKRHWQLNLPTANFAEVAPI